MSLTHLISIIISARSSALPLVSPLAPRFDVRAPPPANCKYSPDGNVPPLPATLPAALTEAFASAATTIDASVNSTRLPSIVATVAYNGETIWTHGAGETSRGSGIKPTERTVYRIGSVSKVFAVLQLYLLADEGSVSLDDTLADHNNAVRFVNPFGMRGSDSPQPTLRQLASQRGGLPREGPCLPNALICTTFTNEEMVERINNQTVLIAPPDDLNVPSYSNLAYALLGRELTPRSSAPSTASTSSSWENWVQEHILDVHNLTRTGFGLDVMKVPDAATGYGPTGVALPTYSLGWTVPCGGMSSSTRDLAKLAHVIMSDTLLKSTALASELLAPVYLNVDGKTLFGTPWEMQVHETTGFLVRRKGGNVPGYSALLAFIPELKLSISVLWSGAADEFGASNALFDGILPPFVAMLAAAEAPPLQPASPQSFVGVFKEATSGTLAQISIHDGLLLVYVQILGVSLYLKVPDWHASSASPPGQFLQLWAPRTLAPCLTFELQAFLNQYVVFKNTSSLTIPGLVPGVTWVRE